MHKLTGWPIGFGIGLSAMVVGFLGAAPAYAQKKAGHGKATAQGTGSPALKQARIEAAKAKKLLHAALHRAAAGENALDAVTVTREKAGLLRDKATLLRDEAIRLRDEAGPSNDACLESARGTDAACATTCDETARGCADYAPHAVAKWACAQQGAACTSRCAGATDARVAACGKTAAAAEVKVASAEAAFARAEAAVGPATERAAALDAKLLQLQQTAYLPLYAKNWSGATACPASMRRVEKSDSWYCMDTTEVTTKAYAACVKNGRCTAPGSGGASNFMVSARGTHPINRVNWSQAAGYCAVQGQRLPTDEEWEYGARGPDGREFSWGNEAPSAQFCWNGEGNDLGSGKRKSTCAVGSFRKGDSPFGLTDMAGNVYEWTAAGFTENAASWDAPHVSRGGGWQDVEVANARAAIRFTTEPTSRDADLGFRCAGSAFALAPLPAPLPALAQASDGYEDGATPERSPD